MAWHDAVDPKLIDDRDDECERVLAPEEPWRRHPVSQADVAFGYRLFLGRAAESDHVTAERAGQPTGEVVAGFVASHEFGGWTAHAAIDPLSVPRLLREPCARDLLGWAMRFFALDVDAAARAVAAAHGLELLAVVLEQPRVAAELTPQLGAADRDMLVETLRNAGARLATGAGGATAADIYNLYLLLLDRTPETTHVSGARPDQSVLAAAAGFVASHEFATELVVPAFAGKAVRRGPLAPALRDWTAEAFGLSLNPDASRAEALAALLRHPPFAHALAEAGVPWDAAAVAQSLAPPVGVPEDGRLTTSFRQLVDESGLFDAAWYLAHHADVRRTGADPLDHFVYCGAGEGRDPGPGFETAFYVEQDPDLRASGLPPFEHYLRFGREAGLSGKGPGPFERWLARYDELRPDDRERIAADAAANPLPPVLWLHLLAGTAEPEPLVRDALAGQIGAVPIAHILAGAAGTASAAALVRSAADGTVVVLSAGGAVLRPHACYVFANALARGPAELAYCDHDHVGRDGHPRRPVFKPAMSPDLMRQLPYAGPVAAARLGPATRAPVLAVLDGGATDPVAAVADLLLARPERVARLPLPLFSLVDDAAERPYDPQAGCFEPVPAAPDRHVPPPLSEPAPRVALLIPTRDRWQLVRDCVTSVLERTDYPRDRLAIVVIDNDTSDPDSLAYLDRLAATPGCAVVRSPGAFNFAQICNDGAAATDADVLVFLNNDTSVIRPDWLRVLAGDAMRPEIGAVGAQLLYPDDTVQHGGVVLGLMGVGGHRLIGAPVAEAATLDLTREMTAVTGACLAIRRATFEQVGGFDVALGVAFNDVDLCIRVQEAGFRNLYVAQPLLHHHESKSRGFDDTRAKVRRNAREAIYARSRYNAFFRDDPSYNPNLSLQRLGELAHPPRLVRPWRRRPERRTVLLLSIAHGLGHGVAAVVAEQARVLRARGWSVIVGGSLSEGDRDYPGCRRVRLSTAEEAAAFAVADGVDAVIAHTPPFFSASRYLGARPLFYVFDHGEPPSALFRDAEAREDVDWEKRFCAPLAHRVFTISQAVYDQQFRGDAVQLRNGNSHLASWTADWAERRAELRRKWGLEGRFVVLNVCRFHEAERAYKGVDDFVTLAGEARYVVPGLFPSALFVLAGRGDPEDVAAMEGEGLTVFANLSDAELAELYAAADLYVSLSRWEGYNLGIGQALAMGLDVIASDIPAHREFGVPVAGSPPHLCRLLGGAFARWQGGATERVARVESWDVPMNRLADLLEADQAEDAAGPWL